MKTRALLRMGLWLVAGTTVARPATGLNWIDQNTNLTVAVDLRLRYELDWDSHTATGELRDDRNRGRLRARVGANYRFSDLWSAGARIRTGNSQSQQSPHLTFVADDGSRDGLDFVADRYFVQFKSQGFSGWGGRNTTPFWQQNELFWDEDVTPTGLAGTFDTPVSGGGLTAAAGAFFLPDGGYGLNGQMVGGQVKYHRPVGTSQFTVAAGLHYQHGEEGANYLLTRNGERDYTIGVLSGQWILPAAQRPLTFGADLFHNFENYSAADAAPFPASDTGETLGYALSVQWGQLRKQHDWLIGYSYAHIETFAVNASYAQDDWVRFGSSAQTAGTDIQGHEIRLGYALSSRMNVLARVYIVEAITTRQDGNRFRIDLNWRL